MANQEISLTDAAAERVVQFMEAEGGVGLRLGVRRTGCSGWAYEVGLAKNITDRDRTFEDRGIRIVVDHDALPLVSGTRIDFVRHGLNRNFEFHNPNVTDECGCGESFTVSAQN